MNDWIPLTDGWALTATSAPPGMPAAVRDAVVPAEVPGFVHLDLLAAGLIPDPYRGRAEEEVQWVGRTGWRYQCRFSAPDRSAARTDLVFEGLDTIASITLNGQPVGATRNMHRAHRFEVGHLLAAENELVVDFAPILDVVEHRAARLGELPHSNPEPYAEVRKMACNFGWDWGPALAGAGIWKPAGLHRWDVARLAAVRPHVTVDGPTGQVTIDVHVERADQKPLSVRATIAGRRADAVLPPGADHLRLSVEVPDPELWWPIGHGAQTRYDLEVTLSDADTTVDSWQRAVGFRTVRLDTTPDEHGSRFAIVVNDRIIKIRGVNWIPDDGFPTRVTGPRYRERIGQAIAANVNLLRVWGGGTFESDDFFGLCDELGMLTWQDFLFACAAYREDEETAAEVEAEVRANVARLMAHPSLVLWCGNNENLWAREEWPLWQRLGDTRWGADYYHRLLPELVAELDPTRPYIPGSPFAGRAGVPANDERHGATHVWDVWNELDYLDYRDKHPRFVAEFGFCGPPAWATLADALDPADQWPGSAAMLARIKAEDGPRKLRQGLQRHFPVPSAIADWHFLAQVNQARAIAVGVEHFRSLGAACDGTVLWQLNDCWPVISWSVVDGAGRLKPAFAALRAAYRPRLVTVQPGAEGLDVVLDNDTGEPWAVDLTAGRHALKGARLAAARLRADVAPRSTARLPLPAEIGRADQAEAEFVLVDGGPRRALWFFARDKDLRYPAADFRASVTAVPGGVEVTVRADSLLRDLCLFADRVAPGAAADDALITLLPDEEHTFRVSGASIEPAGYAALTGYPALRAVNDVVGAPAAG